MEGVLTKKETIDLWHIPLTISEELEEALVALLAEDECAKADRYYFPRHRRRYIACRSALRLLLGQVLNVSPESILFTYGEHGKPELGDFSGVYFNVSHSAERGIVAISHQYPLGVDVEFHRPDRDLLELAARYFTKNESARILTLTGEAQLQSFYNCWTRKEAILKAIGEGLMFPLDQCEVSLDETSGRVEIATVMGYQEQLSQWRLFSFVPEPQCSGALAVLGPTSQVIHHQFTWE